MISARRQRSQDPWTPIFSLELLISFLTNGRKAWGIQGSVVRAGNGKIIILSGTSPPLLCRISAWQLVGVLLQLKWSTFKHAHSSSTTDMQFQSREWHQSNSVPFQAVWETKQALFNEWKPSPLLHVPAFHLLGLFLFLITADLHGVLSIFLQSHNNRKK